MRLRLFLVATVACVTAVLLPLGASAQPRMLIGFQDDPSLRWRDDRLAVFDLAQQANAGIVRTTVYWSRVAQTRPANGANPFDPAYRFDDLDEFVRNAELRGMDVMLTIWGTPSWANGGKGQNFAPTSASTLGNFARALASRYSGRYSGYPFVKYYTVWNESNLGQFLSPQYDAKGKPVAPAIYARLFRAAYAGIKLGNRLALVGAGETSARGRDRFLGRKGTQETESPGKFAELLSKQKPLIRFDAWSHHPYPVAINGKPLANVRWPNVTLRQMPRFEASLATWFKKKDLPMWVTEYAHQTKPPQPKGVTYAQQSAYAAQAIAYLAKDPRVEIFIWFILRDDPTSAWQSGLLTRASAPKPAYATFARVAKPLDGRNPYYTVPAGVSSPTVRFSAMELYARSGAGANVGLTLAIYDNGQLQKTAQQLSQIGVDGWVKFDVPLRLPTQRRHTYQVTIDAVDNNGNKVNRSVLIQTLATSQK
jgi:putative glycosyl hydrolase